MNPVHNHEEAYKQHIIKKTKITNDKLFSLNPLITGTHAKNML